MTDISTNRTASRVLRVTAERVRRGWTQAELARRAHLDPAILCKIERRRLIPYQAELARLARALKVAATELMTEVGGAP